MPTVYHVTPQTNLSNILTQGLIPQVGPQTTLRHDPPAIYLFTSRDAVDDAVMNWLGDVWDDTVPLSLLTIHLPADWPLVIDAQAPWEAQSRQPIPPALFAHSSAESLN